MADEVKITYETLFEFLRREKSRDELQKLDDLFYQQVADYLKQKKQPVLETDQNETAKSRILLENIHRIIIELYQRREKKILDMALIKSRVKQSTISIHNLLNSEKTLFNALVLLLDETRHRCLDAVLTSPKSVVSPPSLTLVSSPTQAPSPETITMAKVKKILFLDPVPQFIGEELEAYGPFNPGDQAELPLKIAELLIEKEHAQEA